MIQIYHSKAGGGKSMTMLMDAIRNTNKKIAIITYELGAHNVLKRLKILADYLGKNPEDVNCTVFDGVNSTDFNLIKKIESLKNEFDIIIVEGFYVSLPRSKEKFISQLMKEYINDIYSSLFSKEKSKCEELWVDLNSYNSPVDCPGTITKALGFMGCDEMKDKVSIKKYSYREFYPIIDGNKQYLNIIDFNEKTIESHDMSKIFKTENQFN